MAQATHASIPQAFTIQQAAAEIAALINSRPMSPRQEEIEAILAKVVPDTALTTPLLTKIREALARLDEAFDVHGRVKPGDPVEEAAQARIDQLEGDLEDLEGQISNPPQSFADLLAWAEIARAGADVRKDGTMAETTERDVFARPAARLIEAVLQFPGAPAMAAMSSAHAAHYREWRAQIERHVREFCAEGDTDDDARMAAHMEIIAAIGDKILAEPVRAWGDLLTCAEVVFWHQWAGFDPEGPHARGQMDAGPSSCGEAIDQAITKVLKGIFSLAGVGQFGSEARS